MNPLSLWRSSSITGKSILSILIVQLAVGACVHAYWMSTANERVLRLYFDSFGVPILLLFGSIQALCAVLVFRNFSSHQPLGTAWQYIMLASVCNFIGIIFKHLFSLDAAINPLRYLPGTTGQTRIFFANVGTVIGGPIQLILLGAGLYMTIRVYRQLGMVSKLKIADQVLLGGSLLYSVVVICGVVLAFKDHPERVTIERALTWPGDYLLSLLLLEAVFLRRAALNMGWGYISRIWGAFATGIFLASFCSLMNWLMAYGILTWIQVSFVWYLWYGVSAAFALAPVYQWEAVRTAQIRLAKPVEELGLSVS